MFFGNDNEFHFVYVPHFGWVRYSLLLDETCKRIDFQAHPLISVPCESCVMYYPGPIYCETIHIYSIQIFTNDVKFFCG